MTASRLRPLLGVCLLLWASPALAEPPPVSAFPPEGSALVAGLEGTASVVPPRLLLRMYYQGVFEVRKFEESNVPGFNNSRVCLFCHLSSVTPHSISPFVFLPPAASFVGLCAPLKNDSFFLSTRTRSIFFRELWA